MKKVRWWVVMVFLLASFEARSELQLFVSPDGNDAASGERFAPLATLEGARKAVRQSRVDGRLPLHGVTVNIMGGEYALEQPFELTADDAGTDTAPIAYVAFQGQEVLITGGRALQGFEAVRDQAVIDRLNPAAREHVLQADLKAQGITDFGECHGRGFSQPIIPAPLELFFNNQPMTLARWPNEGFASTGQVLDPGSIPRDGDMSNRPGRFKYEDERMARWANAADVWMFGYWCWDWADESIRIRRVDVANKEIELDAPHTYGIKEGKRFYVFNVLEELDSPGEYYLDRQTGILYFWPPSTMVGGKAIVSMQARPLAVLRDTAYVTLRGLTLEFGRGSGIHLVGGTRNRIEGCVLRNFGNVAFFNGDGGQDDLSRIELTSRSYTDTFWNRNAGTWNGIVGCDIYNTGEGGIVLGGGERRTLLPGRNYAENNDLYRYSRAVTTGRPGIWLDGVGNRASHNRIHDAPHCAIMFWGNEHRIELNEVFEVCRETGDAGAIYTGRDWTMRGTEIRNNYLHDLHGEGKGGVQAIYLDDMASGIVCSGNVISNVERAFLIGGGRDNIIRNNIVADCAESLSLDARGLGWAASESDIVKRLDATPIQEDTWRLHYPLLAAIREETPGAPKGNIVKQNVIVRSGAMRLEEAARSLASVEKNLETSGDPGFVNAAKNDFQLKKDSSVYRDVGGFERIPFDKIGLCIDAVRTRVP